MSEARARLPRLRREALRVTAHVSRAELEDRLRDIQAITDAALSRLDDRGLLAELLDRTRAILRADTAAVLLLDISSGELIATAAAGLEEEVRQGVRIPVGWGFAGRIAATHQPVIVDHVDQLIPSIRPWKRTYCSAATYLFSDCPGRRRLG